MDSHPLADVFPLIEGAEFQALVDDVRAHGVLQPIVVFDEKILDGRNRFRAAQAAGVPCPHILYSGADPLAFVVSQNLKRRHLNESQRAMVAAKLANIPWGVRADRAANLPLLAISQADAAALLSVGERLVRHAKSLLENENATPELVQAVDRGELAVSAADKAADLAPDDQRAIVEKAAAGELKPAQKVLKQKLRDENEKKLAGKIIALPEKKYGVIYADPEWRFETYSPAGLDMTSPDNHYPTSALEEIKARAVPSISADDCVLFLWATAPMMPQALEVMAAWGFEYKSQTVWFKDRAGTGYWFRNRHELLLIGTRGRIVAPAMGTQWESVTEAPVGEHSAKPEIFYELIESYFPTLPKIELNARAARPGWDSWGLEAPSAAG